MDHICERRLLCVESSLESAPLLERQNALLSLLKDSNGAQLFIDGLPLYLVDENAYLVGELQLWLDSLARILCSRGSSHLPSLFINGLVKVCRMGAIVEIVELLSTAPCRLTANILICPFTDRKIVRAEPHPASCSAGP